MKVALSRLTRLLLSAAAVAGALSCGDSSSSPTPAQNPVPVLASVTPLQLTIGAAGATLTLTGRDFIAASRARWNDQDRPTTYVNDTKLTVDLTPDDLASPSGGQIVVVNPAPAGGTSVSITLVSAYPVPTVSSIAPTSAKIGATTPTTITVTGSGFLPQSTVRIAEFGPFHVVYISPTQVTVTLESTTGISAGVRTLSVMNPAPGGGFSNGAAFSFDYIVPQLTSLFPDTTLIGAPFTLAVNGSGFFGVSVVRWNGSDRPTTFLTTSQLRATISADDVASAASAAVTVFTPAPGGGASNSIAVRIRSPAPKVTSVTPAVVAAGAESRGLTVAGANFSSVSSVFWNGLTRPSTFISATSLTVALTSDDLATVGTGTVSVVNPGSSGSSNPATVAIVPPTASMAVTATVALKNSAIVPDPVRSFVYASVPAGADTRANSVVKIDPSNGAIVGSVAVGSNPGWLAVSDDGQYLYVAMVGTPTVVRVNLTSFTKDIEFPLGSDMFDGPFYADRIVPLAGTPRSVAVVRRVPTFSDGFEGIAIYDDGVARPKTTANGSSDNLLVRGPSATLLYGHTTLSDEFGVRSYIVASDGIVVGAGAAGLVEGFDVDVASDGGFMYSTKGAVVELSSLTRFGTIDISGAVCPDATHARVHYLSGSTIKTFHYMSFTPMGTYTNSALTGLGRLERWGTDGIVAGEGDSIVFLRGAQIVP